MKVVLLHAFPLDARMWEAQREALAGYEVVAPTLYPLGRSLPEWAEAVLREVEGDFVAVGASMGGYLALELVRRAPERVAGIVLAGSHAAADSSEARAGRADTIRLIREEGVEALWRAMRPRLFPAEAEAETLARARASTLEQQPEDLVSALEAIRERPDSHETVAALACPLLVLVGDADPIVPLEMARAAAERASGGRLAVLEGTGHFPSLEHPEAFNRALMEFLARWPRAGAESRAAATASDLPPVVDAAWLAEHLGEPDLLVADVRGPNAFARHGHIPGSLPLVLGSPPPMSDPDLIREYAVEIARRLGRHGVSGNERLVLYDQGDCASATASAQLAELAGHPRVAVLAGGIAAWHGELETGPVELEKVKPSYEPRLEAVPTRAELLARLDDPDLLILDVRTPEEYAGRTGAPCDPRQGRIPRARNLEYSRLFAGAGRPLGAEMIERLTGLPKETEIVTYCHSGSRSALATLALRSAGYRARNYAGSWHEWSRHPELPAERG